MGHHIAIYIANFRIKVIYLITPAAKRQFRVLWKMGIVSFDTTVLSFSISKAPLIINYPPIFIFA